MPATISLVSLRLEVRDRADMPHGDVNGVPQEAVGDAELNRYLNASLRALHDKIIQAFGEDYFEAQAQLTTSSSTDRIPLPLDFFHMLGLELSINNTYPSQWMTIYRAKRGERNRYVWPTMFPLAYGGMRANLLYELRGTEMRIVPPPTGGLVLRMDYVPLTAILADFGTITLASPTAGDELIVNGQTFSWPLNTALAWGIGQNITSAGVLRSSSGIVWKSTNRGTTGLPAPSGSVGDTFTDGGGVVWLATGIGGADDAEVIANQIQNNVPGIIAVRTSATVVTVTTQPDSRCIWVTNNPATVQLSPVNHVWTGWADEYNGWLEYVVVDGHIKCARKEQYDVSDLKEERMEIEERILRAAADRDLGEPASPTDVQTDGWGPTGAGWGGGF